MAKVFQIDTAGTLLTGLVSYYKLEDVNDFYGTNHLSNINAATFQTGKVRNGAKFNGTTQYLRRANPLSVNTTNISMFGWVYISTTSEKGCFWNNGKNTMEAMDGYGLGVGAHTADFVGNELVGLLDGIAWLSFAKPIGAAGWHFVGMTRDALTWRGYVDNVVAVTIFTTNPSPPTLDFTLGADNPADIYPRYWRGMVDEFGFWNKVLSAQERTDLYNGGAGQTMVDSNPVLVMTPGAFLMAGAAVSPRHNKIFSTTPGTFSVIGKDMGLRHGYVPFSFGPGAFSMTGSAVNIKKDSILDMTPGSYLIGGKPVTLKYHWWSGESALSFQFPKRTTTFRGGHS